MVVHQNFTGEQGEGTFFCKGDVKIDGGIIRICTSSASSAGTDAKVHLKVNNVEMVLDLPSDEFERGNVDLISASKVIVGLTMAQLRSANIKLWHDNTGNNAGWKINEIELHVLPHGFNRWGLYKRWTNIGWLATDEAPYYSTEVYLQ